MLAVDSGTGSRTFCGQLQARAFVLVSSQWLIQLRVAANTVRCQQLKQWHRIRTEAILICLALLLQSSCTLRSSRLRLRPNVSTQTTSQYQVSRMCRPCSEMFRNQILSATVPPDLCAFRDREEGRALNSQSHQPRIRRSTFAGG